MQEDRFPVWSRVEQLWTCGADDEQRTARPPVEMFDEIEQTFAAPVDVLENEDQRVSLGMCFEKTPPGGESLATISCLLAFQADEGSQVVDDPARFFREGIGKCGREFGGGRLRRVRVENPGEALYDPPERIEGQPVAIRKRAAKDPSQPAALG